MLINPEFLRADKTVEVVGCKARVTIVASPLTAEEQSLDSSIVKGTMLY